jgi:hypothetical protein
VNDPNLRPKRQGTDRLLQSLSARDLRVLQFLLEHRYATTTQIRRLEFAGHRTVDAGTRAATRVLARLWRNRLVYRLERPVGGVRGGSGAFVWGLDETGDRAVRAHSGMPRTSRKRSYDPSLLFLAHTLAVTELRITLHESARTGKVELLAVQTEPDCWRQFHGRLGGTETLKPDLHAVTASGGYEDHSFLEVDRGTESLAVLLAKCRAYQRYWSSGREQQTTGLFPQTVWLIEDADRRARLRAAIEDDPKLDTGLFSIVTVSSFLSSISV